MSVRNCTMYYLMLCPGDLFDCSHMQGLTIINIVRNAKKKIRKNRKSKLTTNLSLFAAIMNLCHCDSMVFSTFLLSWIQDVNLLQRQTIFVYYMIPEETLILQRFIFKCFWDFKIYLDCKKYADNVVQELRKSLCNCIFSHLYDIRNQFKCNCVVLLFICNL